MVNDHLQQPGLIRLMYPQDFQCAAAGGQVNGKGENHDWHGSAAGDHEQAFGIVCGTLEQFYRSPQRGFRGRNIRCSGNPATAVQYRLRLSHCARREDQRATGNPL